MREATLEDRPEIIRMLRDAHAAAGPDAPFEFSMYHAVSVASNHIVGDDCLALISDGGMLLANAQPHPFADTWFATETVWWIDPDARGGSGAARMLRYFEDWARGKGCSITVMAALAIAPHVGKLYERLGYIKTETLYRKCL